MTSKNSNTSKVTKDPEPIEENETQSRINLLEARVTQLETMMSIMEQKAVTFDSSAKRLLGADDTGSKKVRKPRAKRILTAEEIAAFHARMVAGRLAKEKSLASKK